MPEQKDPLKCACSFSAEQVAEALVEKIKDPKTAQEIMDVWGSRIDQQLGRGLRRFGLYVLLTVLGLGAMNLGVVERLFK